MFLASYSLAISSLMATKRLWCGAISVRVKTDGGPELTNSSRDPWLALAGLVKTSTLLSLKKTIRTACSSFVIVSLQT
jgi:hypothetical protein